MESGSVFRPYQYLPKPRPPLTAIDRFLLSHENYVYPFSGANASSSSHANGISWPKSLPDPRFIEGFFLNEQENGLIEDAKTAQENKKESWKKAKEGNSTKNYLVKGQWTDEEDRKLVRLVKQFGERKWAQIAEKMDARAGKQCRERWHNHLRPDIKKDTWSEEEELLLVETHKQLGNKWAEIAKRIPGRTENSIKNHWNATKRRMNSRRNKKRKNNQQDGGQKERSNVLQDYIRSVYFTDDSFPTASSFHGGGGGGGGGSGGGSSTATTVTPRNSTPPYSDDDAPSLITHQTCDEEMNFMQNLFGIKNSLILCDNTAIDQYSTEAKETQNLFDNNSSMISSAFNSFPLAKGNVGSYSTEKVTDNVGNYMADSNPKEVNQLYHSQNYYCPDIYLSYFLNGSSYMMNQASSGGNNKVEVDLMEMVSSSHLPQGAFNNAFF